MNNKVSITFKGDENKAMAVEGFLALSPISRASGICYWSRRYAMESSYPLISHQKIWLYFQLITH